MTITPDGLTEPMPVIPETMADDLATKLKPAAHDEYIRKIAGNDQSIAERLRKRIQKKRKPTNKARRGKETMTGQETEIQPAGSGYYLIYIGKEQYRPAKEALSSAGVSLEYRCYTELGQRQETHCSIATVEGC